MLDTGGSSQFLPGSQGTHHTGHCRAHQQKWSCLCNNIFKNVKEALRERKRRELEGNNGETPSSKEQDVLHGRASMPQQGQQLVEDHAEENFP